MMYVDDRIDSRESDKRLRGMLANEIVFYNIGYRLKDEYPDLQEEFREKEPGLQLFIEKFYENRESPKTYIGAFWACEDLIKEIRINGDEAINQRLNELIVEANQKGYEDRLWQFLYEIIENFSLGLIDKEIIGKLVNDNFEEFKMVERFYSVEAEFVKSIVKKWFLEHYEEKIISNGQVENIC